jgi:hypothetical protein
MVRTNRSVTPFNATVRNGVRLTCGVRHGARMMCRLSRRMHNSVLVSVIMSR